MSHLGKSNKKADTGANPTNYAIVVNKHTIWESATLITLPEKTISAERIAFQQLTEW